MPQVVKADLRRQARANQRWAELPLIEVVVPQWPALRGSKHERVTVTRRAGKVGGQFVAEKPRQANGALCVGLGWPGNQPAAYLAGGLDYSNRAAEQVESLDAMKERASAPVLGV